jgi:hypothetical protein
MTGEAALLELDVQLEFADYVRFQYYDSLRRLWWVIPFFLLAGGTSFVLFVISAVRQDSYLLRDIIPFSSLVFLGSVFLVASPYLTARRNFDVKPGLRKVIRYRIYETHLSTASVTHQGKLSWSKVKEVRETGSAFLIYVAGAGAFILPKHEFPADGDLMSFRELLLVILGPTKCRFQLNRISSRF